jgi:hypothetical protein
MAVATHAVEQGEECIRVNAEVICKPEVKEFVTIEMFSQHGNT